MSHRYVRKGDGVVHVLGSSLFGPVTVCGLPVDSTKGTPTQPPGSRAVTWFELKKPMGVICRNCDRMKDASTA